MRRRSVRAAFTGGLALLFLTTGWCLAQDDLISLKAREHKVRAVVDRALPSTVGIRSAVRNGGGSGVVVSADGLVLTAAHVTQATGDQVVIVFPDGLELAGHALGANRTTDAGMIQIDAEGPFPFVELGPDPEIGDWCLSLGHPGGYVATRPPPVRLGQVLGLGRFIVTDCALTNGDSGGPLLDLEGRLIGIHSSIGPSLANNNHVAVKSFQADWERMRAGDTWGSLRGGERERAILGIRVQRLRGEQGFRIEQVVSGTPAEEAGLKADDEIIAIDGQPLEGFEHLRRALREKSPGDHMELEVRREQQELVFDVELISSEDLGR